VCVRVCVCKLQITIDDAKIPNIDLTNSLVKLGTYFLGVSKIIKTNLTLLINLRLLLIMSKINKSENVYIFIYV